MNVDQFTRDKMITEWFCQDWIGDKNHLPEPEDIFIFMKILIDVISSGKTLNEEERKYILGRAAVLGATQEMIDELRTYQPDPSKDIKEVFQNVNLPHVKMIRPGIIYNLFRTLCTNHKLHREELAMIYSLAKKFGVNEEQVQEIQTLYEEEENLREKRASIIFPNGFGSVLAEYQKLH